MIRLPKFRVGEIIAAYQDGSEFVFSMPYYHAETMVAFVDRASPGEIDSLIADLFALVEEFLLRSTATTIPVEQVLSKSRSTVQRIDPHALNDGLRRMIAAHEESIAAFTNGFVLPIGPCHGDLNFSNMLYDRASNSYVLLDFLDCYFDSPLHDLIKLKQETTLRWSSLHYHKFGVNHDRTKYAIVMDYIDEAIHQRFDNEAFFRDYLVVFEFQNLLRLLPYTHDQALLNLITDRMAEVAPLEEKAGAA